MENCTDSEAPCINGQCIPQDLFCDGIPQCKDFSDERDLCGMSGTILLCFIEPHSILTEVTVYVGLQKTITLTQTEESTYVKMSDCLQCSG